MSDEDGAPIIENSAALLRVRGCDLMIIDTTEDPFDSMSLRRSLRGARET